MIAINLTSEYSNKAGDIRNTLDAAFPGHKVEITLDYKDNHLWSFGLTDYRKVLSALADFNIPFKVM